MPVNAWREKATGKLFAQVGFEGLYQEGLSPIFYLAAQGCGIEKYTMLQLNEKFVYAGILERTKKE